MSEDPLLDHLCVCLSAAFQPGRAEVLSAVFLVGLGPQF